MEYRILGPLEVAADGRPIPVGGEKQRALLAILLLHRNKVVSVDRLIDDLWGESPPVSALRTLQAYVSRLRKALSDGLLTPVPVGDPAARSPQNPLLTRGRGYLLRVAPDELDLDRFAARAEQGRTALAAGRPQQAADVLREALDLWRGPPLAEFAYEGFAQAEIRRLEELRLAALESRIEADLQLGLHTELIGELEALLVEQPSRERLVGQLMLSLYRSGRQADALGLYQRTRAHLAGELGFEPGAALQSLQRQVLEQSPALRPPAREQSAPAPHQEHTPSRRIVTVLCVGVSPPPGLDPEVLDDLMTRCFEQTRAAAIRHGGSGPRIAGDELLAPFGLHRVHEDDALRAVRAAVELRDGLDAQLGLVPRITLSTGEVMTGRAERGLTGYPMIQASRLQGSCQPGEILLAPETHELVRAAVEVRASTADALRLERLDPAAPAFARRLDLPIVGRERELRLLRESWTRACAESECHLFTMLGDAGVGKSRLIAELLQSANETATILHGRCLPYGEGITFWPVLEALSQLGSAPAHRLREMISTGTSGSLPDLFLELRRVLKAAAQARPVILHIDDLQWAEPMLLDLLESVVDLSRGAPILVLCAARLRLMQDRPDWGGGKLNATTLLLKPLGRRDCDLLIDQLAGELPAAARAEVIAASEGNPLYLEEMVALISERGAVGVPGTIHALLAQRLDGLPSEERELLELGAVEGEVFHRKSVSALAGDAPAIDTTLEALLRKQLIRPHEAILEGDDAFRFHHLLLRDAAYATLGKSRRVGLHERFATWLESLTPEPLQRDELVGWHLEQAVRFRGELGDESESKLRRRAATHLHKAGRRAARRGDVVAAVNLYERAVRLVDGRDAFTALVNVELAGELLWAGELTRAGELLAAWEREPEVAALAAVTRFEWLIRVRPEDAVAVIESELPAVIEALERDGNEQGIARAHMAAHQALNFRCCWAAAAEQARLAVEHAGRAGDSDLRWRALAMYFGALVRGPQHADVLAAQLDKIEREERDPDVFVLQSVRINNIRSQLAGLEGRLADARDLSQRATDAARALGLPELLAACDSFRAFMELDAGEPEAALEALLRCDANLAARNDRGNRSSIQAMLAHTYELLGDSDSALAALQWLDELGSPEVFNDVVKQRVRGRLALAAGRRAGAERCARAAVEEALRSDWPTLQADARLDLARVLSALGRHEQASAEAGAALELFEGKGSVPGAARARALLGALATV